MSVSPANSRPGEETEEKLLRASNSHAPHKGNADKASGNGKSAPAAPGVTDEQLLGSYRQGNKPAFAQLVERYQRELFHFLV